MSGKLNTPAAAAGAATGGAKRDLPFISWFRGSAPYINAHKGRCFVIALDGETLDGPGLPGLVHDIALLASLGVRLLLVHGARPQLECKLQTAGHASTLVRGRRVTDLETLGMLTEVCGQLRSRIESLLSMGLANSPMHGARIRVCGGNFVTAQPVGIIDGVDFQFTGKVRRVDTEAVSALLLAENIVLLPPLGYSPTGETFSLRASDLALSLSLALEADKLIMLQADSIQDEAGSVLRELTLEQARQHASGAAEGGALKTALRACEGGIDRCHILDSRIDGALLQELFTRDGAGTLVKREPFETIRRAGIEDLGGVMELLAPLEQDGTLVRRSRELLEMEIGHFYVAERDRAIIACAAFYPDLEHGLAELACVATHPDYRRGGRGARLLEHIEALARKEGLQGLFVLTTVSGHWFQERGFEAVGLERLSAQRQALYNYQRNSRVYLKQLSD